MVAFSKSFNPRYFNNVIAIIACLLLNLRHIYSQKIGTYPWGNHVTAEDRMQEIVSFVVVFVSNAEVSMLCILNFSV